VRARYPAAVHRAAVLAPLLALACSGGPPPPPNLLLLTVDTLRADRLACYGGPADVGRELCALAENGTRFAWAFSTAPSTAPSVTSILSSSYPARHGVTQSAVSFLPSEAVTVAEVLADAGYTTAAFVSNPVLDRSRNLTQGFAVWDQRMTRAERNRPDHREREAEAAVAAALAWARVGAEAPWFLWVHLQDPHGPYEPPGAPPVHDPEDAEALPVLANHSGRGGIPAYQALPGLRAPESYERRYRDEIRYLGAHVERLVAGLDALGEPPAVLLTSDHGEAFGEDGYWFAHGHSVGLDQIRVPLLWRPPGRVPERPGRSVPGAVGLVDVAPTLVAAAGLPLPEAFAGRPLPVAGVDAPAPTSEPRPVFAEDARRLAVVLGGAYYARDRESFAEAETDRTSGGKVVPLRPRTARLLPDGTTPGYARAAPDGAAAALEELVAGYAALPRGAAHERAEPLPAELRESLEALGYLE